MRCDFPRSGTACGTKTSCSNVFTTKNLLQYSRIEHSGTNPNDPILPQETQILLNRVHAKYFLLPQQAPFLPLFLAIHNKFFYKSRSLFRRESTGSEHFSRNFMRYRAIEIQKIGGNDTDIPQKRKNQRILPAILNSFVTR